uniref:Uncharacterized protein n=1 Tax=Aegilops tauschii TaxID=37682 RepID=M8CN61_AEGTA
MTILMNWPWQRETATRDPETLWGLIDKKSSGHHAVQAKPLVLKDRLTKARKESVAR